MSENKVQYGEKRGITLKEAAINTLISKLEEIEPIEVHIKHEEVKEIIHQFNYAMADLKVLTANRLFVLR